MFSREGEHTMPIASPKDISCPHCGLVDRVQKVSALVESGTVAGRYSTTAGTHISAVTLSAKASQLARPREPTYKGSWGCFSVFFVLFLLFWGFAPIVTVLAEAGSGHMTSDSPSEIAGSLGITALVGVFFFFFVWLIVHNKSKTNQKRRTQYERDKAEYARALITWNSLYYCERDDVVFLPGKAGACLPASQISGLLYSFAP
jgi:hypothetical protein